MILFFFSFDIVFECATIKSKLSNYETRCY